MLLHLLQFQNRFDKNLNGLNSLAKSKLLLNLLNMKDFWITGRLDRLHRGTGCSRTITRESRRRFFFNWPIELVLILILFV